MLGITKNMIGAVIEAKSTNRGQINHLEPSPRVTEGKGDNIEVAEVAEEVELRDLELRDKSDGFRRGDGYGGAVGGGGDGF